MEDKVVEERSQRAISSRNKENYLKAKAAFNQKDMAGCMSYYAPDHHIRSRDVGPGRQHIERFLSSMHESWPDLVIVVEHAVAEDDWVVGRGAMHDDSDARQNGDGSSTHQPAGSSDILGYASLRCGWPHR